MGRLFWKFFFFFLLAQLTTIAGVGTAIWIEHLNQTASPADGGLGRRGEALVGAAAATLERRGAPALRELLDDWARQSLPPVYAVDEKGAELLGRDVPAATLAEARKSVGVNARAFSARQVNAADGHMYVVFETRPPARFAGVPTLPRGRGFPPIDPIVGGLLASLIFAALLAWYVAKPIRNLRSAFHAAARGDLDVRLSSQMGKRRDELADLGREFDRTSAQLKSLMDGQRRLLHEVSHELRSPLARMQMAVGLARQQPDKLDEWMDRIERESVRMDKLVDELLTLSRVEAGVLGGSDERVPIAELVHAVVADAEFEATASGRNVQWQVDVADQDGTLVTGRAEFLHRAIENIVRNAVKHTPDGGQVQIAGRIDLSRRKFCLTIDDEGPGVPEAELASIFEPFFRGAGEKDNDGHGVGLAIARGVIEAHSGTVRASNRVEGGLRIEVTLSTR